MGCAVWLQLHYTAQRGNSLVGMIDRLTLGHNARSPQLCTKPRLLDTCSRYHSVQTSFRRSTKRWFVPRTWFDHVPAGTVLAGTVPARTRFRVQEMVCTENMFREHVPAGTVPRTSVNARYVSVCVCLWVCVCVCLWVCMRVCMCG